MTYNKLTNPTPSHNVSFGFPLGTYWKNTLTDVVFYHKTNGIWIDSFKDYYVEPDTGGCVEETQPEHYIRPADWLEIDGLVNKGDEKFVGLYKINENSNFVSFSAGGAYTVDWGDGIIENYASMIQCYHQYNYVDFVGSESTRGYRQVIITITPQVPGTFRDLDLQKKHNQVGLQSYTHGWLDIVMSAPFLANIYVSNGGMVSSYLEKFTIKGDSTLTKISFNYCPSLQTVELFELSSINNTSNMFAYCTSLLTVPLFNTSKVTNMQSMFQSCSSLKTIPMFDTALVKDMIGMFESCNSLPTVPLFNTESVITMVNMFAYCNALQTVPLFNTSKVKDMQSMVQSCTSLKTIPLLNTESVTNMQSMLAYCTALQTIPLFNTSKVINMQGMVQSCSSIHSIPFLNMENVTITTSMINSCRSLQLATLNGNKVTFACNSCKLSASALVDIFNNLATVSGKTITITNNWGTSLLTSADRAIATDKGWTISG